MKKLTILMLLLTLLYTACSDEKAALKTSQKYLETVQDSKEAAGNSSLYDITDWLTPETEYICPYDNISENLRIYTQYNNNGETRLGYISAKTGELFDICSDPLCNHGSECPINGIYNIRINPEDSSIIFGTRIVFDDIRYGIYKTVVMLDTKTGEISEIYRCCDDENVRYLLSIYGITENYLYIDQTKQEEIEKEDGSQERKLEDDLVRINLDTYEVDMITQVDSIRVDFITDNKLFSISSSEGTIFTTDLDYTNKQTIFDISWGNGIVGEYNFEPLEYVREENAMYFLVRSDYITSSRNNAMPIEEGHIFRMDLETYKWEQLKMPSDKINGYYLDGDYIYYTVYDPINFGASRVGDCIDKTGNKVYRVPRDNTTAEPELIFDGHYKLFPTKWWVMGDYFYFEYSELIKSSEMTYFRHTYKTARVNFKENTIKWLDLN